MPGCRACGTQTGEPGTRDRTPCDPNRAAQHRATSTPSWQVLAGMHEFVWSSPILHVCGRCHCRPNNKGSFNRAASTSRRRTSPPRAVTNPAQSAADPSFPHCLLVQCPLPAGCLPTLAPTTQNRHASSTPLTLAGVLRRWIPGSCCRRTSRHPSLCPSWQIQLRSLHARGALEPARTARCCGPSQSHYRPARRVYTSQHGVCCVCIPARRAALGRERVHIIYQSMCGRGAFGCGTLVYGRRSDHEQSVCTSPPRSGPCWYYGTAARGGRRVEPWQVERWYGRPVRPVIRPPPSAIARTRVAAHTQV